MAAEERHGHEYNCKPTKDVGCDGWILQKNSTIGGKSANATVYIACRDLNKEDCTYALKLAKAGFLADPFDVEDSAVNRIEHEVQMQNLCAAKGFCMPVVDWWYHQDDRYPYNDIGIIITGLLRETVFTFLRNNAHNISETWDIFRKCLRFIYNFHQTGMYHGDAHMSNIMFTHESDMKFIDLDSAREYSELLRDEADAWSIRNAVAGDYHKFSKGLSNFPMDMSNEMRNFYDKMKVAIRSMMVEPIERTNADFNNVTRASYMDELRDMEYNFLNFLLAMPSDTIINFPGNSPPVVTNPLEKPVPVETFLVMEIPVVPQPSEPVNVELLGPPRSSIQELAADVASYD